MLVNYQRSAHELAQKLYDEGVRSQAVLDAVALTPRHQFVDAVLQHKAYQNTALPIGLGQTISQPLVVARMTEILLQLGVSEKVLEIGTGSGYQSAILARCFKEVYSVERIKSLQWQARRRLQQLDLYNVHMKHGDGWQGWQAKGPYQGILVTAAPSTVPQALLQQLVDGGVLITPIGEDAQQLVAIKRCGNEYMEQKLGAVKFVPLIQGELE